MLWLSNLHYLPSDQLNQEAYQPKKAGQHRKESIKFIIINFYRNEKIPENQVAIKTRNRY